MVRTRGQARVVSTQPKARLTPPFASRVRFLRSNVQIPLTPYTSTEATILVNSPSASR